MTMEKKIREIMKATGWKQHFEVSQSTVNRWLSGLEPEGHRRDAINETYDRIVDHGPAPSETYRSRLWATWAAGAEVEPEFEQVPPEGMEQVTIPFPTT